MNTSTKSLHLVLAVELINFLGWMGNGDYFEIFLDFYLIELLGREDIVGLFLLRVVCGQFDFSDIDLRLRLVGTWNT